MTTPHQSARWYNRLLALALQETTDVATAVAAADIAFAKRPRDPRDDPDWGPTIRAIDDELARIRQELRDQVAQFADNVRLALDGAGPLVLTREETRWPSI
jgi:hypothetical protein